MVGVYIRVYAWVEQSVFRDIVVVVPKELVELPATPKRKLRGSLSPTSEP